MAAYGFMNFSEITKITDWDVFWFLRPFAITSLEEGSNTNYKVVGQRLVKTEERFKISGIEIVPITQTFAHQTVPHLSVLGPVSRKFR